MLAILAVSSQPEKGDCPFSTGCCAGNSSSAVEIFTSIICSFITTLYMMNSESSADRASYASAQDVFAGSHLEPFHIHPSAGVMFGSCLVLGCSASSFLYRHAQDDPYQALVFAFSVVGSIAAGELAGASFNMILLGYIPWAVCIAMFCLLCGHALAAWMKARADSAGEEMEEKTALFLWP